MQHCLVQYTASRCAKLIPNTRQQVPHPLVPGRQPPCGAGPAWDANLQRGHEPLRDPNVSNPLRPEPRTFTFSLRFRQALRPIVWSWQRLCLIDGHVQDGDVPDSFNERLSR